MIQSPFAIAGLVRPEVALPGWPAVFDCNYVGSISTATCLVPALHCIKLKPCNVIQGSAGPAAAAGKEVSLRQSQVRMSWEKAAYERLRHLVSTCFLLWPWLKVSYLPSAGHRVCPWTSCQAALDKELASTFWGR